MCFARSYVYNILFEHIMVLNFCQQCKLSLEKVKIIWTCRVKYYQYTSSFEKKKNIRDALLVVSSTMRSVMFFVEDHLIGRKLEAITVVIINDLYIHCVTRLLFFYQNYNWAVIFKVSQTDSILEKMIIELYISVTILESTMHVIIFYFLNIQYILSYYKLQ